MAPKNHLLEIKNLIDAIISRIQVNHIVCVSSKIEIEKLTVEQVQADLKSDKYHKIEINMVYLLNDKDNKLTSSNELEGELIIKCINNTIKEIESYVDNIIHLGEYIYEFNELFRELIRKIDEQISQMNYEKWKELKDPFNNLNVTYVLINGDHIPFSKIDLDIETFCMPFIESEFQKRCWYLQTIKNYFVNIYSNYLLIPNVEKIPTLKYNCTKTDIVELILSLQKEIDSFEKFKAIMLESFEITSTQFNSMSHEIRNRKKDKSQFINKLSAHINKI